MIHESEQQDQQAWILFKVFLLFCTMDSLPSRLLQEGMIFLVHLEPKHLTSKSMQVILRCFFCSLIFSD